MAGELKEDPSALFDQVPSLSALPRQVEPLPGGLTNRNYKVTVPGGTFVARVFAAGGELLAINRDHEYRNTAAAAAAGAGAPVIDYRPDAGLLVIGYLEGRTLADADVAAPGTLPRIAATCRRLHEAAPFVNDFDIFTVQRSYLNVVQTGGFRFPAGYHRFLPRFEELRQALAARPATPVPCHNDLLAGNLIDDGTRIWLIDYEYSGNNDPCFELGNIASECHLPPDALDTLVTEYYGRPRRAKVARARLLGLAAAYGWTLWGAIQAATSPIDADFWSWAVEHCEAAAAGFTGPDFRRLLEEAQGDD